MRKSVIILLIIIQMAALFIFENVHALFQGVEVKEKEQIVRECQWMGELLLNRHGPDIEPMRRKGFFDRITFIARHIRTRETIVTGKNQFCTVNLPLPDGRSAEFYKVIRSTHLDSIQHLKKIFSGIAIVLGIFLLISGIFLIHAFRKPKEEKNPDEASLTPFQNYLVELKSVQSEMERFDPRTKPDVAQQGGAQQKHRQQSPSGGDFSEFFGQNRNIQPLGAEHVCSQLHLCPEQRSASGAEGFSGNRRASRRTAEENREKSNRPSGRLPPK